ncbi:predicted protein [Histoplasma mississippiense (nom. inval.)]|uniref:predicted protein n=1 Tax=Ajellomyces capsulatus (strain NAm1 / WU24) TaxID=2059318 RepID=UPI000157BB30|nr:predicted protein [Histoplasma mississippiense (nom. inval.)]EDN05815.1 predicted protein [Histoplasma mississippiense (nom. inval.)]
MDGQEKICKARDPGFVSNPYDWEPRQTAGLEGYPKLRFPNAAATKPSFPDRCGPSGIRKEQTQGRHVAYYASFELTFMQKPCVSIISLSAKEIVAAIFSLNRGEHHEEITFSLLKFDLLLIIEGTIRAGGILSVMTVECAYVYMDIHYMPGPTAAQSVVCFVPRVIEDLAPAEVKLPTSFEKHKYLGTKTSTCLFVEEVKSIWPAGKTFFHIAAK